MNKQLTKHFHMIIPLSLIMPKTQCKPTICNGHLVALSFKLLFYESLCICDWQISKIILLEYLINLCVLNSGTYLTLSNDYSICVWKSYKKLWDRMLIGLRINLKMCKFAKNLVQFFPTRSSKVTVDDSL